jgi:uncharacterized protein YnzC (UPF0291/DUF896 family)
MITKELIARINELAKKQKTVGLTKEEKDEQGRLRKKYIDSIKAQVRTSLEQVKKPNCSCHSHVDCNCNNH